MDKSRIFRIYKGIKHRCYNKKSNRYHRYGGRGIKMCKEWLNDYQEFENWSLKNGYKDNLTIDRIDHNGNYEPNNCRWVTQRKQQNNRDNNIILTYNGKTMTLSYWADEIGIKRQTIWERYKAGKPIEEILSKDLITNERLIEFNGKTLNLKQWEKETGIHWATIRQRLEKGWDVKDALTVIPVKTDYFIEHDGKIMNLKNWSIELGINPKLLYNRKYKGWTDTEILFGRKNTRRE